jgi:hypothetical protein
VDEQTREWRRRLLFEHPEWYFAIYEGYAAYCQEQGIEPEADVFGDLVQRVLSHAAADAKAVMDEFFPEEEMERLIREETGSS